MCTEEDVKYSVIREQGEYSEPIELSDEENSTLNENKE